VKSLDLGVKQFVVDKSEGKKIDTVIDAINEVLTFRNPVLLTNAIDSIYNGPSHTISAPSSYFGVFMSMISTKHVAEFEEDMDLESNSDRPSLDIKKNIYEPATNEDDLLMKCVERVSIKK